MRLRDDLHQRHAGPVIVDETRTVIDMEQLTGILLQMHTSDTYATLDAVYPDRKPSIHADRRIAVLRDLVALRKVGVGVVLAMEDRAFGYLAVERQSRADDEIDGGTIGHREHARRRRADGTGARVGIAAELIGAAAEHLGSRQQLRMDFNSDYRLVYRHGLYSANLFVGVRCAKKCALIERTRDHLQADR